MSLLSKYCAALCGRNIPPEVSRRFVDALKGATLEQQQEQLDIFCLEVLSQYPITDPSSLWVTFYEGFLPEDDPFAKAFRERRIPVHTGLALMEYAFKHSGDDGRYIRQRLGQEMELRFPLKPWAAKLHKKQEGKSEAEKQRLELKAYLRHEMTDENREKLHEPEEES